MSGVGQVSPFPMEKDAIVRQVSNELRGVAPFTYPLGVASQEVGKELKEIQVKAWKWIYGSTEERF